MKNTWKTIGGLLIFGVISGAAYGEGKVLLVQSYFSDYPWVNAITEGVKEGLKDSGAEIEVFYMDTKRNTARDFAVEAGKRAAAKVDELKPAVVITADDNAQEFFGRAYAGKPEAPSIVFCGVNAKAKKYGYPAANVTGILEHPFWKRTMKMVQQIDPAIKKIALLTDKSGTSDDAVEFIKSMKQDVEVVSYDQPETFAQWQETVKKYQDGVDAFCIYLYHTVKKEAGQESMDPKEVMAWTVANNKKLLFALMPFAIEDGAVCGIVESGQEHGLRAGQMAAEILKGKKAADIPIETAKKGTPMVNVKSAKDLGIEIPPDLLGRAKKIGAE